MLWSSTSFPNETGLYLRFADGQSLNAEDILRDRIQAVERTFSRDAGGSPDCGAGTAPPDRRERWCRFFVQACVDSEHGRGGSRGPASHVTACRQMD
jgi:hypothetical protein